MIERPCVAHSIVTGALTSKYANNEVEREFNKDGKS